MPVRNSAKALVLHEGKILVNRCTSRFGDYYALPGGGQREGETLLEAVRRELLEETGFRVVPLRLSGLYEPQALFHLSLSSGRRAGRRAHGARPLSGGHGVDRRI